MTLKTRSPDSRETMASLPRRLWPLAALPLLAACASALLPYGLFADDDIPAKLLNQMARLDRNRDGLIDAGEFPDSLQLDFQTVDRDGDGRLNLTEVVRGWLIERLVQQRLGSDELYHEFTKVDLDRNGIVTRNEYPRSDDMFDELDTNHDQHLEFQEVLARSVDQEVEMRLMENDMNSDGGISHAELPEKLRVYVRAMDTNGDHLIDQAEARSIFFMAACEAQRRRSRAADASSKPALSGE